MKHSGKPVRKCHGCGLNFGDCCGVYDDPHAMWQHRSCPGYKNETMLQEYLAHLAKHPADPRKARRQMVAKLRATESHHQGARDPARTATAGIAGR